MGHRRPSDELPPSAVVLPYDVDAEEAVLGAMLLSRLAISEVREVLTAQDFYRETHASIFAAILDVDAQGIPADPITVADAIGTEGRVVQRLREIVASATDASRASHYAEIVRRTAVERGIAQIGWRLTLGELDLDDAIADLTALGREDEPARGSGGEPFTGLSHSEVLDLSFGDEPPDLIEGLIPRGVLVTVVGLPETFKGWLCQEITARIAEGTGDVLDRAVVAQGPVGYFWQDDSTRNEAERVQTYARVHETPRELPLRWFLNEGLRLPRDLARLQATIRHHGFVLVVLDSFYNVAADLDLKEREAGAVFAALKAEVCDPTGCTVVVVDHMPWATDTNRKRLRSYGDVFKNAAVRAGIYLDADGSKLFIEARGNNIVGFRRTPAYWDADALTLRLADSTRQEEADEDLDKTILAWLVENPSKHLTKAIREAIKARHGRHEQALERLKERGEVCDFARDGGAWSGRRGSARYWIASVHAAESSPHDEGARLGEVVDGASERATSPRSPHPRRGGDVDRGEVRDDLVSDALGTARAEEPSFASGGFS